MTDLYPWTISKCLNSVGAYFPWRFKTSEAYFPSKYSLSISILFCTRLCLFHLCLVLYTFLTISVLLCTRHCLSLSCSVHASDYFISVLFCTRFWLSLPCFEWTYTPLFFHYCLVLVSTSVKQRKCLLKREMRITQEQINLGLVWSKANR